MVYFIILVQKTIYLQAFETPEAEFRNRVNSRDKKTVVRESSFGNDSKIRSALTSALAKKNGEKYNFFEDEQVKIYLSIQKIIDIMFIEPKQIINQ